MNIAYKAMCRAVQMAFRMALPILPYREPRLYGKLRDIVGVVESRGIRSVLLVTDPFLRQSGCTARLEHLLKASGVDCAVYDRTNANPTVQNVEEAIPCTTHTAANASLPLAAVPPWTAPRPWGPGWPFPINP